MAERIFNLPETKNNEIELRGIISGVEKDNFFQEKNTKSGKPYRRVNFGVKYDNNKTIFVTLNGMTRDKVYVYKKGEKAKEVLWSERNNPRTDGFRLIGMAAGLKKYLNEQGQLVNENKSMTEFDACQYIKENLKDDCSVFIRGRIDYQSYTDSNGNIKRSVSYVPSSIFLCNNEVDYNAEKNSGNEPKNCFTQTIIFMGIEKEKKDDKDTGRFIVSGKVVTYNSIEDVEFIVVNKTIANTFKKNLKPYNAIEVYGKIEVTNSIETVTQEDDEWGEPNEMGRVVTPTVVERVIYGATKETLDRETYTEINVSEAIRKIADSKKVTEKFGDNSTSTDAPWADASDDDEEDW